MTRSERFTVQVAVFLGGAMLMALEIAAFRIIGKTFGSALRETTAVIAVFLAAMSIGYWAGGRVGDRWPRLSTLVATLLLAAATLLAVPWLDALISPRIAASKLEYATHAFAATTLLFAIPTMLFASVSPIAIRLFATTTSHSGTTAGSVSALSTAGSIAGSVGTAFFLIDWLSSIMRTVMFVALGAGLTAMVLLIGSVPRVSVDPAARRSARRYAVLAALAMALVVIPTAAFVRSTRLDKPFVAPSSAWRELYLGDSPYHRISVKEFRGRMRVMSFSTTHWQGVMNVADPYGPGAAYPDSFHIARLMRPDVKRILAIGLGTATAPKMFTHYYDDTVVDVVEIDPLVVDVAKRFFHLQESDRLRVHIADGRTFLKRSTDRWDLIIVDAYTTTRYGESLPAHLATREFLREAADHLNEGGVLHYHSVFTKSKLLPALRKTTASVFDSVLVSGGEIIASDVPLLTSKEVIAERAKGLRLPNLPPYLAGLRSDFEVAPDVPLLTDDYAPVDTLARAAP